MFTPIVDYDIPFADYPPRFEDVRDRLDAAMRAMAVLDLELTVTDDEINEARDIFESQKPPSATQLAHPGTVVHLHAMLTAYDHTVVKSAAQLRTYVTNKLLEETASPTASIRIRALELLGKISDVGLFTEKSEVTLRHRPTEELEQMLREKLERVINAEHYTTQAPETKPEPLDLDIDALPSVVEHLRPSSYVD